MDAKDMLEMDQAMSARFPDSTPCDVEPPATTCATCGARFEGHKNRRYCSNACRQRAYRWRHKPKYIGWGSGGMDAIIESNARLNAVQTRVVDALEDPVIRSFVVWRALPWYKRLWYTVWGAPRLEGRE